MREARRFLAGVLAILVLRAGTLAAESGAQGNPAAAIAHVLDDWHDAAAKADEPRYFAHFAEDGVFLGTDETERWTAKAFREWAKPYFAKGKAWTFKGRSRVITIGKDGQTAWFDELLDTEKMGTCRGSGVLVKVAKDWKIAQYNLSIPVPNELAGDVIKSIAERKK